MVFPWPKMAKPLMNMASLACNCFTRQAQRKTPQLFKTTAGLSETPVLALIHRADSPVACPNPCHSIYLKKGPGLQKLNGTGLEFIAACLGSELFARARFKFWSPPTHDTPSIPDFALLPGFPEANL